jgi:hypothetical protein
MGLRDRLNTAIIIIGLIAIGAWFDRVIVWRQYRDRPTMQQLRFANLIFQAKSDDYKSLCIDARSQAEALSLLAQSIHQSNPSESSAKIVRELDHFIEKMNERLAAKQFTPAEEAGC